MEICTWTNFVNFGSYCNFRRMLTRIRLIKKIMSENNQENSVNDNKNQSNKNQPRDFWKGFGIGTLILTVASFLCVIIDETLGVTLTILLQF